MADGNFIIYFSDGALTYSDKRKGTWYTINPVGVKRIRREKDGIVSDEVQRLKIETKIDPETSFPARMNEEDVERIAERRRSGAIFKKPYAG